MHEDMNEFQFHDGSISTVLNRQRAKLFFKFQFHDGSISTTRF